MIIAESSKDVNPGCNYFYVMISVRRKKYSNQLISQLISAMVLR